MGTECATDWVTITNLICNAATVVGLAAFGAWSVDRRQRDRER